MLGDGLPGQLGAPGNWDIEQRRPTESFATSDSRVSSPSAAKTGA